MSEETNRHSDTLPALQTSLLRASPYLDYIRYSDFKRLLGKIVATVDQDKAKSLAILSADSKDGKTFLTTAIALGYAVLLQKRVLIVNTVLEPGDSSSLQIKKVYDTDLQFVTGLSAVGANQSPKMIELISPQTEGGGNPQADMVDFMIRKFLDTFKHEYDLILLDTCALNVPRKRMIDPIVVAGQADGAIFVTSDNSMNRDSLSAVKGIFAQWQVKVLGTIHNSRPNL